LDVRRFAKRGLSLQVIAPIMSATIGPAPEEVQSQ